MGVSLIIRTGNLRSNANIWVVFVAQLLTGCGFALLTTTTFPEIVDAVENRPDYHLYTKESTQLHISGVFVFISALAQLIGVFFGSTIAGVWSYNVAFVVAGFILIAYAILYAFVCGLGDTFGKIPT